MKASEAARIPALLAARRPPVRCEEATIENVRMLVIIDDEVDTVIRFSRYGSADMPQLCSYPDVAEAAAYADQRLAKQRASKRRHTTGEGYDWPSNWKLDKAKAAGKIWYAEPKPTRLPSQTKLHAPSDAKLSSTAPTINELTSAHEAYKQTVPNTYDIAIQRVQTAISRHNVSELAIAVAESLHDLNRQYYRFRPSEAATLTRRLEPTLQTELSVLIGFHGRSITTLDEADETGVLRLFALFRGECGPVGAGKALHVLAPSVFPLWDNAIGEGYGAALDAGYFEFMKMVKEQVLDLPEEIAPGVTALKALDEYNYLHATSARASAK